MTDDLLRELAPQVLGSLVRRHGQFGACEDAVQEALLSAALQWAKQGVPENPRAWLLTVASRRLVDEWRRESARRQREETLAVPPNAAVPADTSDRDDTLNLLFLCCHPSLSAPSQLALTLRAVGGLTTSEIASAFLVPEATIGQRISRAKQSIKSSGIGFEPPPEAERSARVRVVLQVLYLIFNEGYAASSGNSLQRTDLTAEAIRLARMLYELLPNEAEVAGLLALMLLTDARRSARTDPQGAIVPLAEQRRELWNAPQIEEGRHVLDRALRLRRPGPYQVQAAIASLHFEEEVDWPQIAALYCRLAVLTPSPVVELNRAVAVAMAEGPEHGLQLIDRIEGLDGYRHLHSARADLLRRLGRDGEAAAAYRRALELAAQPAERVFLERRLAEVTLSS